MYENLLPIGSIVRLKGFDKLMMVFGVLQKSTAAPDKRYDYISVPYPEGHYDPRLHVGFNQDDIEEVVFKGYEDNNNERKAFLALLGIATMIEEKRANEN